MEGIRQIGGIIVQFRQSIDGIPVLTPGAGTLRLVMQPDGIHPNAQGVARIVADIGPEVAALVARVQP